MVSNVSERLAQAISYLFQCISFEEIQFNGCELGGREKLPQLCRRFPAPYSFERPFRAGLLSRRTRDLQRPLFDWKAGERVPRNELPPPVKGALMGDLRNP